MFPTPAASAQSALSLVRSPEGNDASPPGHGILTLGIAILTGWDNASPSIAQRKENDLFPAMARPGVIPYPDFVRYSVDKVRRKVVRPLRGRRFPADASGE
ncbi:MAG: hypothetical protein IJQ81_17655 [Oscillibacter sp.]|nr:hypothetical protein [Oscillibacter sp.]